MTSPPILGRLGSPQATPVSSAPISTPSPTVTATVDPFAAVPLATPLGRGAGDELASPPTLEQSQPYTSSLSPAVTPLLPDTLATPRPLTHSTTVDLPPIPTPAGAPPERLQIPRLGLDVAIEPVGLVPSAVASGVFEWAVPEHRAAGWLNTSAPFGQPGNTVLDGHHNIKGEVFRDLWTLQAGDAINLSTGDQTRTYRVAEVLILPERDQPLVTRLANARYIQPAADERLTLVTCWPYEDNSHRTVVIALPEETIE